MTTILAPACARPWAIPRPMPPLPPVTIATLPVRSNRFTSVSALANTLNTTQTRPSRLSSLTAPASSRNRQEQSGLWHLGEQGNDAFAAAQLLASGRDEIILENATKGEGTS